MEERLEIHFKEKQKILWKNRIQSIKQLSYEEPFGWAVIEDTVYGVVPIALVSIALVPIVNDQKEGLLLPIKETESFLKSEFKRLFNIDIPEDKHQYPYK